MWDRGNRGGGCRVAVVGPFTLCDLRLYSCPLKGRTLRVEMVQGRHQGPCTAHEGGVVGSVGPPLLWQDGRFPNGERTQCW